MRINREAGQREPGIKGFLHWWLENEHNEKQFPVAVVINLIIVVSIIITFLEFQEDEFVVNPVLSNINFAFFIFFVIEYIVRWFISTDFIADIKDHNVFIAIGRRLRWMFGFFPLIDLLALLPALRFLRLFRNLRLLRFLRFLKFLRAFKVFRKIDRMALFLKSATSDMRFLFIIAALSIGAFFLLSFGLYYFEQTDSAAITHSYEDAFMYILEKVGVVDNSPSTVGGKVVGSLILIANMLLFGVFISLLTVRMGKFMDDIRNGKIGKLSIANHIILCGFTGTTERVIAALSEAKKSCGKLVLITEQPDIDYDGVIYIKGDSTKMSVLESANISTAKTAVIFAEKKLIDEAANVTDLRTAMTVFNIEKQYPHVHTIAEIHEEDNASVIIDQIKGDEIIFKESIDANLIVSSILHQNISPLLYELTNQEGRRIERFTSKGELKKIGIELPMTVKELKLLSSDADFTFLGLIRQDGKAILAPDKEHTIWQGDSILVLV